MVDDKTKAIGPFLQHTLLNESSSFVFISCTMLFESCCNFPACNAFFFHCKTVARFVTFGTKATSREVVHPLTLGMGVDFLKGFNPKYRQQA